MYAMRLWREYNLRKAPRPMRSRESETKRDPPWEETWGVPDQSWDGGVGVSDWGDDNFGDSWAAPDPAQSGPAARPTTSKAPHGATKKNMFNFFLQTQVLGFLEPKCVHTP